VGHTGYQLSLALCSQGPRVIELNIEMCDTRLERTLPPDFLGLLALFLGVLVLDFIGDEVIDLELTDLELTLDSESELRRC